MALPNVASTDFAQGGAPLSHTDEDPGTSHPGSSTVGDNDMRRANSTMSQSHTLTPSRGGTLKKRQSLSRKGSIKGSKSRRSSRAGSVRSLTLDNDGSGHGPEMNNAFYTPVPTKGSPTEILANRFQVWRKVLKDLITYYRDVQKTYEARSKSLYSLSNVITNITLPPQLVSEGGIGDAINALRDYHKQSIIEGSKAKSIEEDVIVQLTGLRSDLGQKIKEIKGLSGDFKNNVDKETEGTRRVVGDLREALGVTATDRKTDPFLVKLGVDRQVARQIEEENYLHRAFLNLESSGRELESIVMGEIQKAYNAYAGILKREADEAYEVVERLRSGPLALPRDFEWNAFVDGNEHFVNPKLPVRRAENITYPGKDDPAASEVKAGMLERKSKYLKSYTPGWYVLSTTHLHEFKSPDRIASQAPMMSLLLADQKLGSHSNADSSSHKFMLKGRQSGGLHRGHAWVFRAESYDTMLAWFEDVRNLTEKTGVERDAFIRRTHARSVSSNSNKAGSISSDGIDEDEADQVPYSATPSQAEIPPQEEKPQQRPNPGGRFPSSLKINRDSQMPVSPSSPTSSSGDHQDMIAAAAALPGSGVPFGDSGQKVQAGDDETNAASRDLGGQREAYGLDTTQQRYDSLPSQQETDYTNYPAQVQGINSADSGPVAYGQPHQPASAQRVFPRDIQRHDSKYGDWIGPAAAGVGGATLGAAGVEAYRHHQIDQKQEEQPGLQAIEPTSAPMPLNSVVVPQQAAAELVQGTIFASHEPVIEKSAFNSAAATNNVPAAAADLNSGATDPMAPTVTLAGSRRPPLEYHHESVATISELHVPGEFPMGKGMVDSL